LSGARPSPLPRRVRFQRESTRRALRGLYLQTGKLEHDRNWQYWLVSRSRHHGDTQDKAPREQTSRPTPAWSQRDPPPTLKGTTGIYPARWWGSHRAARG